MLSAGPFLDGDRGPQIEFGFNAGLWVAYECHGGALSIARRILVTFGRVPFPDDA
jgi:hypothetical protein